MDRSPSRAASATASCERTTDKKDRQTDRHKRTDGRTDLGPGLLLCHVILSTKKERKTDRQTRQTDRQKKDGRTDLGPGLLLPLHLVDVLAVVPLLELVGHVVLAVHIQRQQSAGACAACVLFDHLAQRGGARGDGLVRLGVDDGVRVGDLRLCVYVCMYVCMYVCLENNM